MRASRAHITLGRTDFALVPAYDTLNARRRRIRVQVGSTPKASDAIISTGRASRQGCAGFAYMHAIGTLCRAVTVGVPPSHTHLTSHPQPTTTPPATQLPTHLSPPPPPQPASRLCYTSDADTESEQTTLCAGTLYLSPDRLQLVCANA